jgi:hypothetical protein
MFIRAGWGLLGFGAIILVVSLAFPRIPSFLGIAFILMGPFMMFPGFMDLRTSERSMATRLTIDSNGIQLVRPDESVLSLSWTDPTLQVDVCQLLVPAGGIFPSGDPRLSQPQWIYVYTPPKPYWQIMSPVPEAAAQALLAAAQAHKVQVRAAHVGFYWFKGVKQVTGQLFWQYEGAPPRTSAPNGRLVQVRGSAWANSPTGYRGASKNFTPDRWDTPPMTGGPN